MPQIPGKKKKYEGVSAGIKPAGVGFTKP